MMMDQISPKNRAVLSLDSLLALQFLLPTAQEKLNEGELSSHMLDKSSELYFDNVSFTRQKTKCHKILREISHIADQYTS